ncbi:hypothetical protein CCR75_006459 [Bremia lactucae]|uniref:Protein kinase domain-containing protein n=1 Tax=Bremia lactucae TaxID=4779 RepID=A0A976FNL7_BRELC|nr:hypothetical protein CCR75_006459 [Bremia lactucae]
MSENMLMKADEELLQKYSAAPRCHRSLGTLLQVSSTELNRSASGRNLRSKHLPSSAYPLTPSAPTPRAPPLDSKQRLCIADSTKNGPVSENNCTFQRRSSFSISAHVLKDLKRVRSSTDPKIKVKEICEQRERGTDDEQEQKETGSEGDDVRLDKEFPIKNNSIPLFGLWTKAVKNQRLPDAIILSDAGTEKLEPSIDRFSSASSSDTIDYIDAKRGFCSSRTTYIPSPSEMVSRLHVTHPHLAALPVLNRPKIMSLTRSTSPRIGRSDFSSLQENLLRRNASPHKDNYLSTTKAETKMAIEASNPITLWKRGELIGLNIATGELFAIKEIEIRSSPNIDQVAQMQKLNEEISLMNNLSHKHIVRYMGSHRSANHFCINMEYVPGGSIASMLNQFDAFNEDLIRIFTRQIVHGVVYLHEMGIIHRDIKGANVLVNEQGVSKLADFGCSKQIPAILTTSLEESLRSIRGSIPWMAPEVVKQTGHGYKADIWSIGATVIEMATAKHPWPHCHNGLAAMYTIAMATAPPPLPDHLSLEAKSFLQRCLCVDPNERATAVELAEHAFLAEPR